MQMAIVKEEQIGGGTVRRTFVRGDKRLKAGDQLTREELLAWPRANRTALIDNGFVVIYPPAPKAAGAETAPPQRFVVRTPTFGSKTFDVIEGQKLAEGLSKEEADTLAAAIQPEAPPSTDKPH